MSIGVFLLAQLGEQYGIYTHPETKSFPAQESIEAALKELTGTSEVQQRFLQVLFQNNVDIRLVPLDISGDSSFILDALLIDDEGVPAFGIGQIEFMMLKPDIGKAWFDSGTRVSA